LLGVYDFEGGAARYRGLLAGWLQAARDGDLLMCHAGLPDGPRGAGDPLAAARAAEFEVLSSPALGLQLTAQRVCLGPLHPRVVPAR
jgi:hypothetical protein